MFQMIIAISKRRLINIITFLNYVVQIQWQGNNIKVSSF